MFSFGFSCNFTIVILDILINKKLQRFKDMRRTLVRAKLFLIFCALSVSPLYCQIEIKVNWSKPGREVSPQLLGVNVWGGFETKVAVHPQYQYLLDTMRVGLLRLHSAEMVLDSRQHPKGWVIKAEKRWDVEKINAILEAFGDKRSRILMTVSNWPNWLDADGNGTLDSAQFDAYAQWCADLVRIININQNHSIRWWTPFNEAEKKVEGNAVGLAKLYKKCATAMKAVDPSILVGGGEWTQPWDDAGIDAFITGAGSTMDFFTYHNYISGDKAIPDADIYSSARGIADRASTIRSKLNSSGLSIPIWITEYNVFWSWEFDQQRGIKGAIFNALLVKYLAEFGQVNAALLWNDCDNTYGVMSSDFQERPNTHLFMLKNNYLTGRTVTSSSKSLTKVNVFAVDAPTGKAVLLINQTEETQPVSLVFTGWTPTAETWQAHAITATGYSMLTVAASQTAWDKLTLPPQSLTLLRYPTETAVSTHLQLPLRHILHEPFPNPFNPHTTLAVELAHPTQLTLEIIDLRGRIINVVSEGFYESGRHEFIWDAAHLSSGVYFCRLLTPEGQMSRRLLLLR